MNIRKAKKKIGGKLFRACIYQMYKYKMKLHGKVVKPYKEWVIMVYKIILKKGEWL